MTGELLERERGEFYIYFRAERLKLTEGKVAHLLNVGSKSLTL